jgi:thymidylate kinase
MRRRLPISLVAFSGLDGSGKSTQIEVLRSRLEEAGCTTAVVWTRGGYTPLFSRLKTLLRRVARRRVPAAGPSTERTEALGRPWIRRLWLTCALIDLAIVLGVKVRVLQWRGKVVLCDRYLHDSLIDFRLAFGDDAREDSWLWRLVTSLAPTPDIAFLFLLPVAESVRRSDLKGEPFRDPVEVLARRVEQYGEFVGDSRYHVLDAKSSIEELANRIATAVALPPLDHAHQPAA